jgi:hypothetical protein
MFLKKSRFIKIIIIFNTVLLWNCTNDGLLELNKYQVIKYSNSICKFYLVNKYELKEESKYTGGLGNSCILDDSIISGKYGLIAPLIPINQNQVLIRNNSGELFNYNIEKRVIKHIDIIPFKDELFVYYINLNLIFFDSLCNITVYKQESNGFLKKFEMKINDKQIFNIYGGINSKVALIEAGYFPSGGCDYVKYYKLNLDSYQFEECTNKILPINNPQSPFDDCYMDIHQEYFFFANEIRHHFEWIPKDDYVLNTNFDTVGRALRKSIYYGGNGYSINKNNQIDFYVWQNNENKLICFPVNYIFEKQIYRTFYDSLLVKSDLEKLDKIEIALLKSTIVIKNDGFVKSEKLRDILSVYAFPSSFQSYKTEDEIVLELKGNEKSNYELLKELQ